MVHTVTLEIPENTINRAQEIAQQTGRPLESILVEWVERGSTNENTILTTEHHVYTPLGGEDTARALQEYLQAKNGEAGR